MASSTVMSSLAILLVLLPIFAKGDDHGVPPILSPYVDNICNEVECGRGSCRPALGSPFNFVCECDADWRRTRLEDEDNLRFLPCIIPNCSLDYSCMPAAPPAPPVPYNTSFFDPCYWIYCGEGTCSKNRTYTHTCECNPGSQNLLNITHFPCYRDCAIGSDCRRLGIVSRSSSSSPSNDGSQATAFLPGTAHWISVLLISLLVVAWK